MNLNTQVILLYFYYCIFIYKGILERYKLSYHFEDTASVPQNNQSLFEVQDNISKDSSKVVDKYLLHDKRLNQLWAQAERSGFTSNTNNLKI